MLPVTNRDLLNALTVWVPPRVWSDGTQLFWQVIRVQYGRWRTPNHGTLEKFTALADADPDDIVRFASNWGPLGICVEHGLPHSREGECSPDYRLFIPYTRDERLMYGFGSEPLSAWHDYASQFRTTLGLVREVRTGRLGNKDEWAKIASGIDHLPDYTDPEFRESEAWEIISEKIEQFLAMGNFVFRLQYRDRALYANFRSASSCGLFGALSLLLMMEVAGVDEFVICSACGQAYQPVRSPNPKRRNYCSKECRKKGNAFASRKYRQRWREERK